MQTNWTTMSKAEAEALAEETGKPVVFVADAVNGFGRHLRDGETEGQAVREFETAGEPACRSYIFGD